MNLIMMMVVVATLATQAPAPTPTSVAATTAAAASTPLKDGDKLVCKSIAVTGTRFTSKVCATKDQWAGRTQDGRDYADHMSRVGLNCASSARSSC
jgi:hypothetical protein